MAMNTSKDKERWVTMKGRHLLIKAGESPEEAWARESEKLADKRDREISANEKQAKELNAEKNGNVGKVNYSVERNDEGVFLVSKVGNKIEKSKINHPEDIEKATVKLTGKGLVYLKRDPNMLKLLKGLNKK